MLFFSNLMTPQGIYYKQLKFKFFRLVEVHNLSKNPVLIDNLMLNRFETQNLNNESFILMSSLTFFFIYPKDFIVLKAKENTKIRDSNDPDGNFHRFGLSSKEVSKKRALRVKREKRFLEKFYLKNKSSKREFNDIESGGIYYNSLSGAYASSSYNSKNYLPQTKNELISKLK